MDKAEIIALLYFLKSDIKLGSISECVKAFDETVENVRKVLQIMEQL